ncbi:PTS system fructose subfamily IIA component, partial [bacterium]|nr:PTS system fructose subfamily IIA component [bacterium]
FHQDGVVDVISGMSLPMMLRFAESRDADSLSALAQGVKNAALESVSLASDLLSVKEADG